MAGRRRLFPWDRGIEPIAPFSVGTTITAGGIPIGLLTIGLFTIGLLAVGAITIGLLAVGLLTMGLITTGVIGVRIDVLPHAVGRAA